jgi:soluble lytic murein transglycosylase-like protein
MLARSISRSARRRRAWLALAVALNAAHAMAGDIVVRDEGADGVVLTDRGADAGLWKPRPPAAVAAPPRAALARSRRFASLVSAAASTHDVPVALLQAVIEVESGFDADAISPKGAMGLMQLMPATARTLGVSNPRDPAANIDGGARYLKGLLARYGNDVPLALAAYNAGPEAVRRSGGIPRIAETQAYVPRVLLRYHSLQSGGRE